MSSADIVFFQAYLCENMSLTISPVEDQTRANEDVIPGLDNSCSNYSLMYDESTLRNLSLKCYDNIVMQFFIGYTKTGS